MTLLIYIYTFHINIIGSLGEDNSRDRRMNGDSLNFAFKPHWKENGSLNSPNCREFAKYLLCYGGFGILETFLFQKYSQIFGHCLPKELFFNNLFYFLILFHISHLILNTYFLHGGQAVQDLSSHQLKEHSNICIIIITINIPLSN